MNEIQGTKPSGIQFNILLDAVVTFLKYNKIPIDHAVYIKFFTNGSLSYLKVLTHGVLNTTNNETSFPEITRFLKENFEMKLQEGSVLK